MLYPFIFIIFPLFSVVLFVQSHFYTQYQHIFNHKRRKIDVETFPVITWFDHFFFSKSTLELKKQYTLLVHILLPFGYCLLIILSIQHCRLCVISLPFWILTIFPVERIIVWIVQSFIDRLLTHYFIDLKLDYQTRNNRQHL